MQLAGASIPIVGGVAAVGPSAAQSGSTSPANSDEWELVFEDDFDGDSLDTDNWGIGWGWGMGAPGAKVTWARERHVNVRDSNLVLTASKEDWWSDDVLYAGGVHSKNKVTVEPPVYFEARCKFIKGAGWQNAFWSKPNDESWPPEIDVVEYLQPDGSTSDTSHNLHYSSSGVAGDSSTHRTENGSYEQYDSESEFPHNSYHVYGVEWRENVIRHYVDGQIVEETKDDTILEAFSNGGAEYLMLSLNLDNVGTTDKSVSWDDREFLCDWVRTWKPSSSNTNDTGNDGSEDNTTHYFWARSADGNPVTFEFSSSGGNIRHDSSSYEADYWIDEDGQTAGGTTDHTGGQLPGLWYDGEIVEFTYDGDLELYIDDQQVDPATLTTEDGGDNTDDTGSDDSDGSNSTDESTSTESRILIDGTHRDDKTARYVVSVSGDIERDQEHSSLADGGLVWDSVTDHVGDSRAVGIVGNGVDAYRYTGTLQEIKISGDATFSIEQI